MKKLLLIWFFSGSLDGFSQDGGNIYIGRHYNELDSTEKVKFRLWNETDTVRALLLVTTRIPGFAHSVVGYCVSKNGACISHLDCRKRVLKLPVKVWGCEGKYPKEQAGIGQ